jgi:hypothetical protein
MIKVKRALLTVLYTPFLIAGYLAGQVVKFARLARAALIEGYSLGSKL